MTTDLKDIGPIGPHITALERRREYLAKQLAGGISSPSAQGFIEREVDALDVACTVLRLHQLSTESVLKPMEVLAAIVCSTSTVERAKAITKAEKLVAEWTASG